jgi:kynurenine formamidase
MSRIIDLSYPVEPHWRHAWFNELVLDEDFQHSKEDYSRDFHSVYIHIHSHAFTHVDAPLHALQDGKSSIKCRSRRSWVGRSSLI